MTVDRETNIITLYWNGNYIGSTTCSHDWLISGGLTDATIPFTVGMLVGGSDSNGTILVQQYTKADIYAYRLYNKVLTDEEVKQNHDKTVLYHNLLIQENN